MMLFCTALSATFLMAQGGSDTAGHKMITRKIVIRTYPGDTSHLTSGKLTQKSFMNFGFARVSPLQNHPNAMPELSTLNSNHIGFSSEYGSRLGNSRFLFWFGIKYDILNYRFENPDARLKARNSIFEARFDSSANSAKSKVVVNYLGVPLALSYHSDKNNPEEGLTIRAGFVAGYRVRTHTKVKLENGSKDKEFDDFNFNDFMVTPFIEAIYNNFGFYIRMNRTPVFKNNQGMAANGIQFGVVMM